MSCNFDGNDRKLNDRRRLILVKQAAAGGKENVWSVDNEMAEAEKEKGKMKRRKKKRRGVADGRKRNVGNRNSRFMVSGAMLVEVETVLQTQVYSTKLAVFYYISITVNYLQCTNRFIDDTTIGIFICFDRYVCKNVACEGVFISTI